MTDQYSGQQQHSQQAPFPGGAASWDYETANANQPQPPQNGWTPAPKAGLIPLRPLSFGEIFGSTFKLLRNNAGVSIGAALIVQGITALLAAGLPLLVAFWASNRITMADSGDTDVLNAALPGWIILSALPGIVLSLVGSALLQVIIVQVVAKGVLSRKAKLGQALKTGWSRMWPILGYFGLYVAVLIVFSVILGLLIALAVWLGSENNGVVMLIVILGTALLGLAPLVAAIWIGTKLTFAMPVIVLERMGPIRAIRRSWKLSAGYFWRTFGILLLLQVIIQVMSQVVGGALGFVMGIVPAFITPTGGIAEGQESGFIAFIIVLLVISMLLSILIGAIGQVLMTGNAAIMYTDLRMRKEGLNIHLQSALETYAEGREPAEDPWLAPDLGPLPAPAPYGAPAYAAPGYQQGYQAPGYQQGYQAPGYQQGYQAPGYQAPGYQQGYQAPGNQAPGYQAPGYPAQDASNAARGAPAPAPSQDAPQQYGTPQAPPAPATPPQTYGQAVDQQRAQPGSPTPPTWAPMNGAWSQKVDPISPASPYGSADRTDDSHQDGNGSDADSPSAGGNRE